MDESPGDLFSDDLFGIFDDEEYLGPEEGDDEDPLTEPTDTDDAAMMLSLPVGDEVDDDYDDSDDGPIMTESSKQEGVTAPSPASTASSLLRTKFDPPPPGSSGTIGPNQARTNGLPAAAWHNESTDKEHRQSMMLEIARLLRARKKTQPSPEWLHQLPYKVRRLEEKLYRSARTLDSYLDRTTLKNRLRALAQDIAKQFTVAKVRSQFSARNNARASSRGGGIVPAATKSVPGGAASANGTRLSQSPLPNGSATAFALNTTASSAVGTMTNVLNQSLSTRQEAATVAPSVTGAVLPNDGATANSGTGALSELERQRAVNQRLQQQILENIRQQEELVLKLQSRSATNQAMMAPAPQQLVAVSPPNSNGSAGVAGIPNMAAANNVQALNLVGMHSLYREDNSSASILMRQAALLNTVGNHNFLPNPMGGGFAVNGGLTAGVSAAAFASGGNSSINSNNGSLFAGAPHPAQTNFGGSLSMLGQGPMSQILPSLQQSPYWAAPVPAAVLGAAAAALASPAPIVNNAMPPPPPNFAATIAGRPTSLTVVGTTKSPASTSFDEDSGSLSPGSFNW